MNVVDIALALLLLAGAYSGYKEGFIVSLFSFVAIVLGVVVGFKLMGTMMILLGRNYKVDESVLPYVAFGLVFIVITICVGLLGRMIKASIKKSALGLFDQAAGSFFGLARTTFMLSIILWIVDSLKIELPEQWTEDSWLLPWIANFALKVTERISAVLPFLKDVF